MSTELPDIAKRAARVAAAIEDAVARRFSRQHRYGAGADLRKQAREVVRLTHVAWYARQRKAARVDALSVAVDDLKIEISIADLVHAWGSRAEMEAIARLVNDLGGRVGGWKKNLEPMGQNAPAERRAQRAPILSARPASSEANA